MGDGNVRQRVEEFRKVEAKFSSAVRHSLALPRQSSIALLPEDQTQRHSKAFRQLKHIFYIIAFTAIVRKAAWRTQQTQAVIKTTELEDAIEVYIPLCTAWLQRLTSNYVRTVTTDAQLERVFIDPTSKQFDEDALFITFLRFKVFINLLLSKENYPPALSTFWAKLADRRLYLPTTFLTQAEVLALPETDVFGSRDIPAMSQAHQTLCASILIARSLLTNTLFPRISTSIQQKALAGSGAAGRAGNHFQLIATALHLAYTDEFLPKKQERKIFSQSGPLVTIAESAPYPPHLFPEDDARAFFYRVDPDFIPRLRFTLRDWVADVITTVAADSVAGSPVATIVASAANSDWLVFHPEGADGFKEPYTFGRPIMHLETGTVFRVMETKGGEWFRREKGGWVHSKSARDGSLAVVKMVRIDNWAEQWEAAMVGSAVASGKGGDQRPASAGQIVVPGPFNPLPPKPTASFPSQFIITLTDSTELLKGPLPNKFTRVTFVEKRTVLEATGCVSVDHTTLFGVKFFQLVSGLWVQDKKSHKNPVVLGLLPTVNRFPDGSQYTVNLAFTPWTAPHWKSDKCIEKFGLGLKVLIDLILKNPSEHPSFPVWARVKGESKWIPLAHPDLVSPVIVPVGISGDKKGPR